MQIQELSHDQITHRYRFYNVDGLIYNVFINRLQEAQRSYLGVRFKQVQPDDPW
jgi:hypothetical protein